MGRRQTGFTKVFMQSQVDPGSVDPGSVEPRARKDYPPFSARAVLQALAKPRLTGSEGAAEITVEVKSRLEHLGYEVREAPFEFSSWPGRFGLTAAGAFYLIGALLGAGFLYQGHPGVALVMLLTVMIIVAGIAVAVRPAMNITPWGRTQGSNLLAHVPGKRPRYFLMAHRDSKSQPIPLAFRGPAIVLGGLAWVALTLASAFALLDPVFNRPEVALSLGALAVVSGVIHIFRWLDDNSPRALHNA